jgi:hypothetical protein
MTMMTKLTAFAVLLSSTVAASAQSGLILPPSPAEQNARMQAEQTARQQQTQLNNLQVQQSNLENQLRQQQLFSPPAYMFNQFAVTPPPRP